MIYKTCWLYDQSRALVLYEALITPHVDYGSVVYEIVLQRLQLIQNSAGQLVLLADRRCPGYKSHEKLKLDIVATYRSKLWSE